VILARRLPLRALDHPLMPARRALLETSRVSAHVVHLSMMRAGTAPRQNAHDPPLDGDLADELEIDRHPGLTAVDAECDVRRTCSTRGSVS